MSLTEQRRPLLEGSHTEQLGRKQQILHFNENQEEEGQESIV